MKIPSLPFPLRPLAICAGCTLLTASALAQAPAPGAPAAPGAAPAATPAPKPLAPMEKTFLKNGGKSIYYLLQTATVAKTTNANLSESAGKYRDGTIKDMTKTWEALKGVAKAHGETLPEELTGADKSDVDKLGKLKDERFAKQWLEDLIKEGKKLAKEFESAEKTAQADDLKMFIINYGSLVRGVATEGEKAQNAMKAKK
jgi:hypothetical protein